MAHRDLHPEYDPTCFGCKALSVNVSAHALENKGAAVRAIDDKDKALTQDLVGYKQMRDAGLQPKGIDGSGEAVKRINSQFDLDLGLIVPKKEESKVRDGFSWARENGLMA